MLLTLAAASYPITYVDGSDPPLISLTGMMIATILLWFPLVFLTDFLGHAQGWVAAIVFATLVFSVLPGFTLLTSYYKQSASLDEYTYFGPMVFNNISIDTTKVQGGLRLTGSYEMHFATSYVTWYDMNCPLPSSGSILCDAIVYDSDCILCEGAEGFGCKKSGDATKAKQCLIDKYNDRGMDIFVETMLHHAAGKDDDGMRPWMPQAQFSSDEIPSPEFYGNCYTCQAMESGSYHRLVQHKQTLMKIGLILVFAGICIFGLLTIWLGVSQTLVKLHRESDSSEGSDIPSSDDSSNVNGEGDNEGSENAVALSDGLPATNDG